MNYYDEESENGREKPTIEAVIEALHADEPDLYAATLYYGLSELQPAEIDRVKPAWNGLSAEYRRKLLEEMTDASEANFEVNYQSIALMALDDSDATVRAAAVEALWEDESPELMKRLIDSVQWDESQAVRAAAASALGRFILLGEYGELTEQQYNQAQDAVISVLTDEDEDIAVRRRALEAIANSSHEIVPQAIEEAYYGSDREMRVSSVFAMGRSCDANWQEIVLRELTSEDVELRYEAARAAGELGLPEAVPVLGRAAIGDDREIKEVAIWSLGEIGGNEALRILTALAEDAQESEDEDLLEIVEEAIGNASLVGGDMEFDLYDFNGFDAEEDDEFDD
jgi:HEAT repeat protein